MPAKTQPDLRTPLRVMCRGSVTHELNRHLLHIYQLVATQGDAEKLVADGLRSQTERLLSHTRLRIHDVHVTQGVDLVGLVHMANIAGLGVHVPQFPTLEAGKACDDSITWHLLRKACHGLLLPSDGYASADQVAVSAGTSLKLNIAVLSALRFSSTIKTVDAKVYDHHPSVPCIHTRRRLWQWIAFALFADGARHSVDKLIHSHIITLDDCSVIRDVLTARHPLALLTHGESRSEPLGQVEATRFCLTDHRPSSSTPSDNGRWISPSALVADVVFRPDDAVSRGSKWWKVLLAGHGIAWVHGDDIQRHTQLEKPHRLSTLELTGERCDFEPVVCLLALIGAPLEAIHVRDNTFDETECAKPYWFTQAFETCPRLESLILPRGKHPSAWLSAVVHCALERRSRLRHLEVDCSISDDPSRCIALVRTLCDPDHPFAASLTQLRLGIYSDNHHSEQLIFEILHMLKKNCTLTRFQLSLFIECGDVPALPETWQKRLRYQQRHPRQTLNATVPRRSKLAFLSAVTQNQTSAMGALDTSVLTVIFAFAGHRFHRAVHLSFITFQEPSSSGSGSDSNSDEGDSDSENYAEGDSESESDSSDSRKSESDDEDNDCVHSQWTDGLR